MDAAWIDLRSGAWKGELALPSSPGWGAPRNIDGRVSGHEKAGEGDVRGDVGGGEGGGADDGGGEGGSGGGGGGGESEKWVTVASFALPTEAHMARLRLESEGVDCLLIDEHTVSVYWFLSPALGGIKLQVPVDQVEQAREVLGAEAVEWDEGEAIEAARCARCGEGDYEMAPIPKWAMVLSVALLGIPLLFIPRRWRCERCGAWMGS